MWRRWIGAIPLPMLAIAASYGVYHFARMFVPDWVAMTQAASFEAVYISLAINQAFDPDQRRRAVKISVGAVAVSIIYNSLSGFFTTQPHVLEQLPWPAWALLAVLHGAPLAWVAYLVSDLLLHSGNGRFVLLRIKEWQCALREQWIETLEQQLHAVRGELAAAVQMAAQLRDISAHEQATVAHHQAEAEQLRAELAQQAQVVAQGAQEGAELRANLVQQTQAAAQTLQELAQVRAEVAQQAQAAAQWRAEAERLRAESAQQATLFAQPVLITREDVARCYLGLRSSGQSEREAAQTMGFSGTTLRGWADELAQAEKNGKHTEVLS